MGIFAIYCFLFIFCTSAQFLPVFEMLISTHLKDFFFEKMALSQHIFMFSIIFLKSQISSLDFNKYLNIERLKKFV
jgi:hypothetical protein